MRIARLTQEHEGAYERFLRKSPNSLFFFSNQYRRMLKALLKAEDHYLLAMEGDGTIRAALPAFSVDGPYGKVLNSLPYYGSNGGVIRTAGDDDATRALVEAFYSRADALGCASATLISSPLDSTPALYLQCARPDFIDRRIGQLTPLAGIAADADDEQIMTMFHSKTRNMIRKAMKLGVEVREEPGDDAVRFLAETHKENMREIGGLAKSDRFFELAGGMWVYGIDYRIYTAWQNGVRIAALLILCFNRVVEYFTPTVKKEYRESQGLSLIILAAMRDAIRAGSAWWNWGGTWLNQDGVYRFKKRWGTLDKDYHYYTRVFDRRLLSRSPATLIAAYPGFYVIPFSALDNGSAACEAHGS